MSGLSAMPDASEGLTLKLLTYNIHSGIGRDGRYDISRIEEVLRAEAPDVIALQELDCGIKRTAFHDQAVVLAERLGMTSNFCASCTRGEGHFGLATLSRFPMVMRQEYDLTCRPFREPRVCLRVDLELAPGSLLHVFNCHFGLATYERRYQRRRMLSDAILLSEELHHPVVVMGDFNDRPVSVVHSWLRAHLVDAFSSTGRGRKDGATFRIGPVGLRLDHIYVSRDFRVSDCSVLRCGAARIASDHQPLVALVELGA